MIGLATKASPTRPLLRLTSRVGVYRAASAGTARSPLAQYDYLVEQEKVKNDPFQRKILGSLEHLYKDLQQYTPPKIDPNSHNHNGSNSVGGKLGSMLSGIFSKKTTPGGSSNKNRTPPKGIYLHGDVGSGKTMLMDMFYTTVPEHLTKKRIHFHAFMQDVHKRAHRLRIEHGAEYDPAHRIADEIAAESNVLCFDEFQVTDVADAMILRKIIDVLLSPSHGAVLFITSNRAPDELYENGIQRASFIPCIELLKRQDEVIYLDSPTDYRKLARESMGTYFFPEEGKTLEDVRDEATTHAENWFRHFAGNRKADVEYDHKLYIWGRPIVVPMSVRDKVAQFSFDDLFRKPLSAADYLEITRSYPAFVVTDIPVLSIREADITRRFITFLDAAYDSRAKLAVTAEKPFEHLFNAAAPGLKVEDIVNDVDPDASFLLGSNLFSGEEERFAFARALSRLKQMASVEWHEAPLHEQGH